MTTVNEALDLLFTSKRVDVFVRGLGEFIPLEEGYHSVQPEHEQLFDDSKVTSIKVHDNGEVFINAKYTKEIVAPITASEDDMTRTHY